MAKLIYANNMSLDGYVEDESGKFDWFPVDDEVFAAHTDLLRSAGTFLYGRRLYEAMSVWETDPAFAEQSDLMAEFVKVWKAASKVVYSSTLTDVATGDTRIERQFDAAAIREMKAGHQQSHHRRRTGSLGGVQCRAGRRVRTLRPPHGCRRR